MGIKEKQELLSKAKQILEERAVAHGNDTDASRQRFKALGQMWGAMLTTANGGTPVVITSELAALMCTALKLHRACYSENEDNYYDLVAYASLAYDYSKGAG